MFYHICFTQFMWDKSLSFLRSTLSDWGSTKEKSSPLPPAHLTKVMQSAATSASPFLDKSTSAYERSSWSLIIGEEDIVVGILGLNGKEDWPWDSTDEMNFQWKLRSRIQSEKEQETMREQEREGGISSCLMVPVVSTPCSFFLLCRSTSLVSHCYCSCKFQQLLVFSAKLGTSERQDRYDKE